MRRKQVKDIVFDENETQSSGAYRPKRGKRELSQLEKERRALPVYQYRQQIIRSVQHNPTTIIVGETGSGKTTQIAQYLHESGLFQDGVIGITQPRRVAAITVAKRVAEERGCKVGGEVGYSVRFDDCTSPNTYIKFITDGMLLREAMMDNELSQYSVIIIDEAHERSLQTDILCSFVKSIQERRKVRLIVMSATLQSDLFDKFYYPGETGRSFPNHVIQIEGRTFPVEVYYTPAPEPDYIEAALITILQLHLDMPPGDILVFLTGQEEIESLALLLQDKLKLLPPNASSLLVFPLYAALPPEQQLVVFTPPPPNTRKVILSTNLAESSVTIPGIKYVVDTGMVKLRVTQAATGLESLLVVPVSKSHAWQRTGRAGRESEGKCFRLFTEDSFLSLREDSIPEIQRCNLASILLQLKTIGINDVLNFNYLQAPSRDSLKRALQQLLMLGAVDRRSGALTALGRSMATLPLDPVYARLLILSKDFHCTAEILDIVAVLSVETIFYSPREEREKANVSHRRFASVYGDHLTFLNVFQAYREARGSQQWCYDNFINPRSMKTAMEIRKQLVGYCEKLGIGEASCEGELDQVRRCLTAGMFVQIAKKVTEVVKNSRAEYKTILGNKTAAIHPASVLFQKKPYPEAIVYTELVYTTKDYYRGVTAIEASWIPELVPEWFSAKVG
ncbi:hypothetical protein WA588_005770 [Blastocystis sp. NMH]